MRGQAREEGDDSGLPSCATKPSICLEVEEVVVRGGCVEDPQRPPERGLAGCLSYWSDGDGNGVKDAATQAKILLYFFSISEAGATQIRRYMVCPTGIKY
jgi:hypothetical protein